MGGVVMVVVVTGRSQGSAAFARCRRLNQDFVDCPRPSAEHDGRASFLRARSAGKPPMASPPAPGAPVPGGRLGISGLGILSGDRHEGHIMLPSFSISAASPPRLNSQDLGRQKTRLRPHLKAATFERLVANRSQGWQTGRWVSTESPDGFLNIASSGCRALQRSGGFVVEQHRGFRHQSHSVREVDEQWRWLHGTFCFGDGNAGC